MADLFENIAPSWVTNHLYQLGDVVLYNKKLYQCTDKHTSSGDIDLDKFKSHTLADMVAGTTQLENFADMTVVSDVVTSDETYTYLEMPNNGVVSDKTKIATLNSNLGELSFSNFVEGTSFDVIVGDYYVVTTQGDFNASYFTGGTVVTKHLANVNENYIATGIIKATSNKITVKNMFRGGSISHISISK